MPGSNATRNSGRRASSDSTRYSPSCSASRRGALAKGNEEIRDGNDHAVSLVRGRQDGRGGRILPVRVQGFAHHLAKSDGGGVRAARTAIHGAERGAELQVQQHHLLFHLM